jgi:glycerol-3-phosphate dehydrogenase
VSGILPPEFGRRPVEHYVAREWAVHLDDVMVRRTGWHYYFRDAAAKAEQVAAWMGELLGWTQAQQAAELDRYRKCTLSLVGNKAE